MVFKLIRRLGVRCKHCRSRNTPKRMFACVSDSRWCGDFYGSNS